MIADALKLDIEAHARRVSDSNPLLLRAIDGSIKPAAVARYLASLRYLVGNTPGCLAQARDVARSAQQHALADFYDEKLAEEIGHEQWAIDDIAVLHNAYGTEPDPEPVAAIRSLVAELQHVIAADPRLYLAYVFWAEYFVAIAGGQLVEALTTRSGFPAGSLTCLSNHVTLDEGHAHEDMAAIDRLIDDPSLLGSLRQALASAIALFDVACEQMVAGFAAPAERIAS